MGREAPAIDFAAGAPGFWMYETSGVLRPAVQAYLAGAALTAAQIAALRAYLRQWIMAPAWRGPAIELLRARIDALTTREAIDAWINDADEAGVDPL